MITKAIIVSNVDDYSAKVRIPIYDKIKGASNAKPDESLLTAYFCMPPGCVAHYKVGEVVYVDFELDQQESPIVIGSLSRENEESALYAKKIDGLGNTVNLGYKVLCEGMEKEFIETER